MFTKSSLDLPLCKTLPVAELHLLQYRFFAWTHNFAETRFSSGKNQQSDQMTNLKNIIIYQFFLEKWKNKQLTSGKETGSTSVLTRNKTLLTKYGSVSFIKFTNFFQNGVVILYSNRCMTWKKVSRKFHDDFTKKITNLPSVKKIIIGWTSVLAPTGPPFLILDRPDINPACILVPPINHSYQKIGPISFG